MKKIQKDPKELEIENKAVNMACGFMLILAFIYFTYEIIKGRGIQPAFYSLITIFNAVSFGYRAIKLEKGRKLNAFTSIIWGLLTILLILDYFKVI